jgi:glycosyltransferase involved in cell wall biosynthesis
VARRLAQADVFAFPSIREFGGGAVLEAMAVGTVPMVVNYAGPAELVTPATGYLIELATPEKIIDGFRAVLSDIAEHPEQLTTRSALGVRRALEQFTWDTKARQVLQVYDWLTQRAAKPEFPMPTPDPS